MFNVVVTFTDNGIQSFSDITSIRYSQTTSKEIGGNEMLSHKFPLNVDLLLIAGNAAYTIAGKTIKALSVIGQ